MAPSYRNKICLVSKPFIFLLQIKGQIMWSSLTQKVLHISPRWMVITDTQKKVLSHPQNRYYDDYCFTVFKVTYTEIQVASLTSLSYAEDENRHILGVKTMQPATVSSSSLTERDLPADTGKFCCHVLECDSEVCIVCSVFM